MMPVLNEGVGNIFKLNHTTQQTIHTTLHY